MVRYSCNSFSIHTILPATYPSYLKINVHPACNYHQTYGILSKFVPQAQRDLS
jgi:hypothetical protein